MKSSKDGKIFCSRCGAAQPNNPTKTLEHDIMIVRGGMGGATSVGTSNVGAQGVVMESKITVIRCVSCKQNFQVSE